VQCHACDAEYTPTLKPFGLKHFICKSCGHRYRTSGAKDAAEYHAVDYTARVSADPSEHRVHNDTIKLVKPYLKKCKTFLDIGPGFGLFEQRAMKYVDIEAIEINPVFVEKCRELGIVVYNENVVTWETENRYDGISIWHVLEHIEDINEIIEKMKLLSNRFVMFEVPTELKGNWKARKYYIDRFFKPETKAAANIPFNKRRVRDGGFRGHFHNFTKQSIIALLEKHNLNPVLIRAGARRDAILVVCEI